MRRWGTVWVGVDTTVQQRLNAEPVVIILERTSRLLFQPNKHALVLRL